MIVDLKKYLFIGAKEDLSSFFLRAQEEGFIEFIFDDQKKSKDLPDSVRKIVDAIKILRKQPVREPYPVSENLEFADEIATQVLDLTHEIEKLSEERRFLEAEIARVRPFGQFSFDDIDYIQKQTHKIVQFYCVKTSKAHEIEDASSLIYIGTDYDLDYFIGIHDKPKTFPGVIEMHFDRTVGELRNHLAFVDETLHQVEAELKGFAGYLAFLRDSLLSRLDIHMLERTEKGVSFPIEASIFSIEGWVPANKIDQLPKLIGKQAVACEPIAIEKEDKVPTCLENKDANRIGEDLILLYDVPSSTDKDPSGWVLWAFVLFFSIILADGGYGILYLGLAVFLKYKFPALKGGAKRFLKLMFILSVSSILWGFLTASFFGLSFSPQNPLSKYSLFTYLSEKKVEYHAAAGDEEYREIVQKYPAVKTMKSGKEILQNALVIKEGKKNYELLNEYTDKILLEASLLIGVIHISLALIRYCPRNWANIGWVAFAIGGYLYFPLYLNATSLVEFLGWIPRNIAGSIGIQLIYGGLGLAIVLAIIQKKLRGVGEVMQVIPIFSDILSYLRLYALALASTIVARTFNEMGVKIGLVVGSLVILAGHVVNISLGTMGGVIHGLRLNFVEWYHYCYEGEGKLFNPLRKLRIKQE